MKRILSILFLVFTISVQSQQIRPDIVINPGGTPGSGGSTTGFSLIGVYYSLAPTSGTTNASTILQAEADYCILHHIRKLQLDYGTYRVDTPLVLYQFYGGNYVGFGLELSGVGSMWDIETTIQASFYDNFIVGIQHGKGVTISNLRIRGNFTPPIGTDYEFYNKTFAEFTDGVSRDSRYSPNCAIAIDPFGNTTALPSDGGYPGMSAWYRGTASTTASIQAGSTSTFITNVITEKTVVGICSSPNPFTRNAEITTIRDCQFRFHKLCVSGGQEQEKQNSIKNCACWYASYMFFATGKYGYGTPGNWVIDGVNIAGYMAQFIDNDQNGYFGTYLKHIYTERLGRFGLMTNYVGRVSASIEDCQFTFTDFPSAGFTTLINSGNNVVFEKCSFRYYGFLGVPMLVQGNGIFKNCSFTGYPIFIGNYIYPRFIDCFANSSYLGLTGIKTLSGNETFFPYGDWTLQDYGATYNVADGIPANVHTAVKSNSQEVYTSFSQDASVSVTITSNAFTFTSSNSDAYYVGGVVMVGNNNFGQVTGITGNDVTVSYLPYGMANGTYIIRSYYPILYRGIGIGNITSGSNTILNYRGVDLISQDIIKNPYGGSGYLKVLTVSGSTITFYGSVTTTKVGAIFGNYTNQEIYTDYPGIDAFPNGYIVRKGDKVTVQKSSDNQVEHVVTAGGYLDATGSGDTRQATWTP